MARKITLFELHFDGINFGSGSDEMPVDDADVVDEDYTESSSPARGRRAFAVVGAVVLASVVGRRVVRRVRSKPSDESEITIEDVESDDAPEAVTAD